MCYITLQLGNSFS